MTLHRPVVGSDDTGGTSYGPVVGSGDTGGTSYRPVVVMTLVGHHIDL